MKNRKDLRKIDKYWRQRKLNVWLTGVPEEENQSKGIEHMLKTSSRQLSWNKRSESIFQCVIYLRISTGREQHLDISWENKKIIWACRKRKHMTYKG